MIRLVAGGASALLLIAALFFVWKSRARADDPVPPAPAAVAEGRQGEARSLTSPPSVPPADRERRRFARADRDRDGRITLAEQLAPRRKAFARADRDGNGSLSFEEWTAGTAARFAKADKDRSGWLDAAEYEASRPKPKPKPKCKC